MSDIFLSYKSKDRPKAKIIAEALEQNGYSLWWDQIIPPGKTFDQVIEEKLDAAKCVIVLWSKESVKSDWVKNEAHEGTQRHILIPVLIDDVKIPFEFRHIQAAHLIDWQGALPNPEFDLILKSVGEILGRTPVIKIENKKTSINELNILAQQFYEEGKYSEAIEAWKKVLNIDSENRTAIDGIQNAKVWGEEEERSERERKSRELAEIREKERQDARQEERRLKKSREKQKRTSKEKEELKVGEQLSYKKILIVTAIISVVLLGYWIIFTHILQDTTTYTPTPSFTTIPTQVIIGTLLPITGDLAQFGGPMENAAKLAIDEVNANGGLLGSKVSLITEDSQTAEIAGVDAANKLVKVNKVPAVIGAAGSGVSLAIIDITTGNNVVQISPSNTGTDFTTYADNDFYFRTCPSGDITFDDNGDITTAYYATWSVGTNGSVVWGDSIDIS